MHIHSWLRYLLFPFSLLYATGVVIRNLLYDLSILTALPYPTPTLCVGNLSVGGTGKTPMIEYLIRMLKGRKTAVLSRGYKRKSKGFRIANAHTTVADLGDEPFQLHQKFPSLTVAVDADRRYGIAQLQHLAQPEVILLDDAFQHRRVKPTLSILLTTYNCLFVNDWYLPTGTLRDEKRQAKRANIIIVTKSPATLSQTQRKAITRKLHPQPHQQILFSHLVYKSQLKGTPNPSLTLAQLPKTKIALVTGIATPQPLINHLKSQGIAFQHFNYPDHHNFTQQQVQQFKAFPLVLTTEKDYMRLQGKIEPLYYIEITHQFSTKDSAILEKAINALL